VRLSIAVVLCGFAFSACIEPREDEEHGVAGSDSGPSGGTEPQPPGVGGGTTGDRGGASNGGSGARGGTVATGGAGPTGGTPTGGTGGTAGTAGCVENLGCELDPPPSTGDVHQDCVNRINQFRGECACLPPLERWTEGEACADEMAEYDSTRSAHAGFRAGICEGGSGQNECPGWDSETEVIDGCLQSMWDEGPPPTEPCNNSCFNMYGHFINMTNEDYGRVACGFYTTAGGEVWAVQNFTD
jgi:hypothetical protein